MRLLPTVQNKLLPLPCQSTSNLKKNKKKTLKPKCPYHSKQKQRIAAGLYHYVYYNYYYCYFPGWRRICRKGADKQLSKTPRAVLSVKNAQPRMAKVAEVPSPPLGLYMERLQSRISLSASFEALAVYFPCMNSFDEDGNGECSSKAKKDGLSGVVR